MSLFDKYTYIIASCRKEAEEYARSYGVPKNRFYFIDTLEKMHGMHCDSIVWLCGQYQDLPNWEAMEKQLAARGIKLLRRL